MRRSLVIAATTLLVACNTLSGADGLVVGTTDPAGTSSTSSGASNGSSSSSGSSSGGGGSTSGSTSTSSTSSTGGVSVDAGSQPTVLAEEFDSAAACTSANVIGSGEVSYADGACVLCAPVGGSASFVISGPKQASGTAGASAKVTVEASVKRLGGATPTNVTLQLKVGGSSITQGGAINATGFSVIRGGLVSASDTTVSASVGMQGALVGDCIVIDALRVLLL